MQQLENGHLYYPCPLCRRYSIFIPLLAVDRYFTPPLLEYTLLYYHPPPPPLAAALYILEYSNTSTSTLPLHFRRGDPCFVCMNENDPAQHCTSQKEALGYLANTALVDYTRHSSTSVRPPKLTTSSPHINYYFCLSPPSLILLFLLQLFPSPSTNLLPVRMLESPVSPSRPSDSVYGLSHNPRPTLSFRQYRAVSLVDRRSESLKEPLPPFGRTQLVPAAAIAE